MKYYIKDGFVLLEGDKIKLRREPDDVYDKYAIELFTFSSLTKNQYDIKTQFFLHFP